MHRSLLLCACALVLAACDGEPQLAATSEPLAGLSVTREPVRGDVVHYTYTLRVGDGPNARLGIHRVVRERAPWKPRRAGSAILAMHGDFANFWSNYLYMAPWLAERDVDVWGLDRRFTQAPAEGADLSDFDAMGVVQEVEDIGVALAFARSVRLLTDGSLDRMTLAGFSRGGQLAYVYAAVDATRPAWQQQLKGLVPLDVYAAISPQNPGLKNQYCFFADFEYGELGAGNVDSPNGFVLDIAALARSAPDEPTPYDFFFPGRTNYGAFLDFAGQTYNNVFAASPWYHLAAPTLDGDVVTGLSESDAEGILDWFAAAPAHSSMREAADTDALLCGEAPLPIDAPLSNIRVPLLLILAAGGYGDRAIYTTTQVSSTDVTTHMVRRLAAGQEVADVGHGDLLFARDAATLAWEPLLSWLRARE